MKVWVIASQLIGVFASREQAERVSIPLDSDVCLEEVEIVGGQETPRPQQHNNISLSEMRELLWD